MTHSEFVAAVNKEIQALQARDSCGLLALDCISHATLTDPADWVFVNGPQSGEGDDIYLKNEKRGLTAWMWDDGSVIHTMEITNLRHPQRTAYTREWRDAA